ncbi:MAG: LysM peptidoglycan-binding domain-containing protein [Clostridia bacterium]|nr:LysM peptidoglycan-binding domain-containing protein [Clostridia bacterium]
MHEVKYGDTLTRIAKEYGVSVSDIAELNNIANPNHIRTGDILKIPQKSPTPAPDLAPEPTPEPTPERTYTVKRKDTLSGIGAKLGIPWRKIAEANGIVYPHTIYEDQVLILPSDNDDGVAERTTVTHKVVRGDTLSAIARRYNTTVAAILNANRSKYRAIGADYIVVGWVLVMPGGVT